MKRTRQEMEGGYRLDSIRRVKRYLYLAQTAVLIFFAFIVMVHGFFIGPHVFRGASEAQGAGWLCFGAGGAIFGLLAGMVIVSFASSIGATLAFLASRFLLRDAVERKFGDKLAAINGGIERAPGGDFECEPVEVPPIRALMPGKVKFVFGLANDEIGYIIPKSEWDEKPPWLFGSPRQIYGEVNSTGPDTAGLLHQALRRLIEEPVSGASQ